MGQGLLQVGVHALAALLIAIESSATDPELVRAMLASCAQARGDGTCVAAAPGSEAHDAPTTDPSTWYARVIWEDAEGLRARIELRRGARERTPEHVRTVTFAAADEPLQRHRAVGLIVASYVAERAQIEADEANPQTQPDADPDTTARVSASEGDSEPEREHEREREAVHEPVAAGSARFGVDLGVLAGTALDASSPRVGLALRGFLGPASSPLAATLALRGARADASSATTLLLASGAVGALLRALQTADGLFALELRAELLAERTQVRALQLVTRLTESDGRWRLGGLLGVEGHAALGSGFGLFLGGDASLLLPAVSATVGGREIGRAPPFGASGLLGLRWSR